MWKNNKKDLETLNIIKEQELDKAIVFSAIINSFQKENNQILDIDVQNKILTIIDNTTKEVLLILDNENYTQSSKVELIALYKYIFNY